MTPIRLILDTTAVRAYPSEDIGETLTQVHGNGDAFTIPLPCLVAARDVDRHRLELLVGHTAFWPADLPYDQWRQLSAMADVLGTEHAAAALFAGDDPPLQHPDQRRGPVRGTG